MTKYVLNSGGLKSSQDHGAAFFKEMVKDLGEHPKVLLCFFALERDVWEQKFVNFKNHLNKYLPQDVKPVFSMALPKTFEAQVADCDAVYVYGGDVNLLQYWLSQFDIPSIWQHKVVAGTSAGAAVFAVSYWASSWREPIDAMGILDMKFVPHCFAKSPNDPRGEVDWQAAIKELTEYGDTSLPVHAMPEGDFMVTEA